MSIVEGPRQHPPQPRKLLEVRSPYLMYDKQRDAIFDTRTVSVIEASTKAGKTSACIDWIIKEAMICPENSNHWWCAPVSEQANIAFDRMRLAVSPPEMATFFHAPKRCILPGNRIIWFKSGDHPDSLYGQDVYSAVIDEASRFKADAWYAIRSTVTATRVTPFGRFGRMRIIGNVKGKKNWFYQLARKAQVGLPDCGYHKMTAWDAVDAGVLDAEEIEAAKQDMPEAIWRELYEAEASDDEGNPFGGEVAINKCLAPLSPDPPYAWGWDLAKSRDWTVGIALDRKGRACRFIRFQMPWAETVERIIRETGKCCMLVDQTGVGDPIVEALQRRLGKQVEGYKFTSPSKQMLMEGLAVAITGQSVSFPDGPIAIELRQFEYQYTKTGVRYAAMEGAFDDCVCALAMAVHCKANRKPGYNLDALAS